MNSGASDLLKGGLPQILFETVTSLEYTGLQMCSMLQVQHLKNMLFATSYILVHAHKLSCRLDWMLGILLTSDTIPQRVQARMHQIHEPHPNHGASILKYMREEYVDRLCSISLLKCPQIVPPITSRVFDNRPLPAIRWPVPHECDLYRGSKRRNDHSRRVPGTCNHSSPEFWILP